jgi:hypothetical protein
MIGINNMSVQEDFCGPMEGGNVFTSPKRFVLLGCSGHDSVDLFDTEAEAQQFWKAAQAQDAFAKYAGLHGFADGKWVRIPFAG